MSITDYFESHGTEERIIENLTETIAYNKANADILFNILLKNQELLLEDEKIVKTNSHNLFNETDTKSVMNFLIFNQSYNINIKYATIAFICLLFDITISKGFATFLFGVFGLDYSAIKLTDLEKCIAYKLKEKKALSLSEIKQSFKCNFAHYNCKCGFLDDNGNCKRWDKENNIEMALNSLQTKNVVKIKDEKYVLSF